MQILKFWGQNAGLMIYGKWMPPERVTWAINGDYLSNGRTCSDEHETEQNKK